MPALTGVRALAAYMVCFFHYNPLRYKPHPSGWRQVSYGLLNEMHTGVTVFFVLSGFLICYRYYDSLKHITWPWFKRYFQNRFARVYPMYLLLTLLTFGMLEWNTACHELAKPYIEWPGSERLAAFLLNLTLVKGFFNYFKFTGLAQGWSLTVEECFYVCAPFFILSFRRSRWAFALLPLATLLVAAGLWQTVGKVDFYGFFSNEFFVFNFTFVGRSVEFFIGMGLAVYVLRQRRRNAGQLPVRRGGWLTLTGLLGFAATLGGLAFIYAQPALVQMTDERFFSLDSRDSYLGLVINNTVVPLFIAALFYGLLTEHTWLRSLLSTKLFDLLGKSSYVFYLIHVGVLNVLVRKYIAPDTITQFVVLNLVAVLLYKFVESPLHRWLKST